MFHDAQRWPDSDVSKLRGLAGDGLTLADIARQMPGYSATAIGHKVKRLEISRPLVWSWTKECEALLEKLWAEGYSANQIANTIGAPSRNAVIGKVNRMGLPSRVTLHQTQRAPRSVESNVLPFLPSRVTDIPEPSDEFNCSIVQLKDSSCCYPHGDPGDADFHYCGAKKVYRSLCAYHAALCYQELDRRKLVAVA